MDQLVMYLPYKHKDLTSILGIHQKKKKGKKNPGTETQAYSPWIGEVEAGRPLCLLAILSSLLGESEAIISLDPISRKK